MTLNKWAYVQGNPTNFADPSGHDVGCHGNDAWSCTDYRDLTDWLYREMVTNARSPEVQKWLRWNLDALALVDIGGLTCLASIIVGPEVIVMGGIVIAGGAVIHMTALYEYGEAVKDQAKWDFKDEIGFKLGPGITLCTQTGCSNDIEYSVPGNIHFAYIGVAAGILGEEIKAGAGYAEITDPAHDPNSPQYTGPYVGPGGLSGIFGSTWWDPNTWNFGDEPIDNNAVSLGIQLWAKYKGNMTKAQFQNELAGYMHKLTHYPPASRPIDESTKAAFPYPVGFFNNRGLSYDINDEGQ